jgi:hypothetical protein
MFGYTSEEEKQTASPNVEEDQFFEGLAEKQHQIQLAQSTPSPDPIGHSKAMQMSTSAPLHVSTFSPSSLPSKPPGGLLKSSSQTSIE